MSIDGLRLYRVSTRNPEVESPLAKAKRDEEPTTIAVQRNRELPLRIEAYPELVDFYNTYDELDVLDADIDAYAELVEELEEEDLDLLGLDLNFYVVDLSNRGGLVMPVILELHFEDGSVREDRIPAEIWRRNADRVSKLVISAQRIDKIVLDPHLETADTNRDDNYFPRRVPEKRIELKSRSKDSNPMRDEREAAEKAAEEAAETVEDESDE